MLTARREMEAWQLVQLEPTAMRRPDEFVSPTHLGTDGRHLAAKLYRLARNAEQDGHDGGREPPGEDVRVYSQITNRLGELIDDVHGIHVDLDEKREIMTLYVQDRDGTPHPARAQFLCLSGTWRAQDSAYAARGDLLPYLNPVLPEAQTEPAVKKRVVDREDVRQLLLFPH